MTNPNQNPAFGAEDQDLIAGLVPTGESVEEILDLPALPNDTQATAASDTAPAPAAATQAVAPAADASATQTTEQPAQHSGDVRAALRAARAAERRLRDQLAAKDAELAAFREGKPAPSAELTDDELTQMREDFPLQAKLIDRQRALEAELQQLRTAVKPPEWQAPSYAPEIQEHIDAVPELLAWQHDQAAQDKFAAAIEHDKALEAAPEWHGKPVAERFAEAARLAKLGFTKAPPVPRIDPAAAIAAAPLAQPKGISDFRGGGTANAPATDFARMSDEAIMATLAIEG